MPSQSGKCPDCGSPLDSSKPACPGCGRNVASLLSTQSPNSGTSGPEPTPKRIGEFRILRTIGRGGMGTVYEAYQESMHRKVALKVLDSSLIPSTSEVTRFEREAWIAGRLSHPNIVKVYSQGVEDDKHFFAMELVEGESLQAEIRRAWARRQQQHISDSEWRRDHIRRMVTLFIGVADALEHVHQQGVVHRDIKPLNLLLTKDCLRLLLSDFGLARDEEATRLTRRGDFLGTPRYMSPEQLLARRSRVDRRTDIWSLGVSLYEAVTLKLPYAAESDEAYISAVSSRDPLPARRVNRAVPRDLETVLMKCLERDPERRYAASRELRDDLVRYLDDKPVMARRPGVFLKSSRLVKRHAWTVTAVACAGVIGAVLIGFQMRRMQDSRDLERIRWSLEQAIRTGKPVGDQQPDWDRLRARLPSLVRRDGAAEVTRLMMRASVNVDAKVGSFGLLSQLPSINMEVQGARSAWGVRLENVYSVLVDMEGALDDGGWKPIGTCLSSTWGRVAAPINGVRLDSVFPQLALSTTPHHLRIRAKVSFYDFRLEHRDEFGCHLGPPEASWPKCRSEQPNFNEVRDLGDRVVTLFQAFPQEFPKEVHEGVAPSLAGSWLEIDRVRIVCVRVPGGGGKVVGFEWPGPGAREFYGRLKSPVMGERRMLVGLDIMGRIVVEKGTPIAAQAVLRLPESAEPLISLRFVLGPEVTEVGPGWVQTIRGTDNSVRRIQAVLTAGYAGDFYLMPDPPEDGTREGILELEPSREVAISTARFEQYLGDRKSFPVELEVLTVNGFWYQGPEVDRSRFDPEQNGRHAR